MIVLAARRPSYIEVDIYHFNRQEEVVRADLAQTPSVLNRLLKQQMKIHKSLTSIPVPNAFDATVYIAPESSDGMRKATRLYRKCMDYMRTYEEEDDNEAPAQSTLF